MSRPYEPILIAYARSREEGNLLRPYIRPKEILHDNEGSYVAAHLAMTCSNRLAHILVLRREDLPQEIIDGIHAKGSRVVTIEELLAERVGNVPNSVKSHDAQAVSPDAQVEMIERHHDETRDAQRVGIVKDDGCPDKASGWKTALSRQKRDDVLADLMCGKNVSEVASLHGVDRRTVRRIRDGERSF